MSLKKKTKIQPKDQKNQLFNTKSKWITKYNPKSNH